MEVRASDMAGKDLLQHPPPGEGFLSPHIISTHPVLLPEGEGTFLIVRLWLDSHVL
jgi:hypothetical protein